MGRTANSRKMNEGSGENIPTPTERANDDDADIQRRRDKVKSATECASYDQFATVATVCQRGVGNACETE